MFRFPNIQVSRILPQNMHLQNAEMAFNFGSTPFKYPLPNEFHPISSVNADKTVVNSNSQTQASTFKPANNAPQAIIIEVSTDEYFYQLPFREFLFFIAI